MKSIAETPRTGECDTRPEVPSIRLIELLRRVISLYLRHERARTAAGDRRAAESLLRDSELTEPHRRILRRIKRGECTVVELRSAEPELYASLHPRVTSALRELELEELESRGPLSDGICPTKPSISDYVINRIISEAEVPMTYLQLRLLGVSAKWIALGQADELVLELNRLHRDGLTNRLLDEIRREYPDEAVEIEVPRQPHQQATGANRHPAARRGKVGEERWRRVQKAMLYRLRKKTLPQSLRDTARLLKVSFDMVRRAAHYSSLLCAHFGLKEATDTQSETGGSCLEELASQVDRRTEKHLSALSTEEREYLESELRSRSPAERLGIAKALSENPDAGRVGDYPLIEEADQDYRANPAEE